jgi:hypothetical protein
VIKYAKGMRKRRQETEDRGRGKMYERKWKRNDTKTKGQNIGIKIIPPHPNKKKYFPLLQHAKFTPHAPFEPLSSKIFINENYTSFSLIN